MKTIIEPFRIRTVEPIQMTTREYREEALAKAEYNMFKIRARDVLIDLLTDSGTGAMSTKQWAALMQGDEAYAGSDSYFELEEVVQELTGFKHIIPCHQGRAAERILFGILGAEGKVIPSNSHFDTTRANIEFTRTEALDLPAEGALEPEREIEFKGNMNLEALRELLEKTPRERIPIGLLTITNNTLGGQPVSMANIKATAELYHEFGIPFFLDAARFAENAFFIKLREPGYADRDLRSIVQEQFSYADGTWISAKKDGLVNMGGLLALNDDKLATDARNMLILTEGFPTYGGLSGRDMSALAQGLREVTDIDYLTYRHASACYLADHLREMGVPSVRPTGIHAVYIDAKAFLPQIPATELPGQRLCTELYVEGGIRPVEIGTLMFGKTDPSTGVTSTSSLELVRMTFPRRVYTQSHFDWIIESFREIVQRKDDLKGYKILEEAPFLRAFTAKMAPIV
jgi:tyrosine phenol-lyase